MPALLEIDRLTVRLPIEGQLRTVLHDISLELEPGEAVGLVGESGAGKSMTARAVARLLPKRAETEGRIRFAGIDVLAAEGRSLRTVRDELGIVFQDPRAHVNPVRRIGDFMTEALRTNHGVSNDEAERRSVRLLADVGVPDGERRLRQYPHELSGGLLQRVMIATSLLAEPKLLLADEPTTALDVTTQAEVMAILDDLRRERGLSCCSSPTTSTSPAQCATAPSSCTPARSSSNSRRRRCTRIPFIHTRRRSSAPAPMWRRPRRD